MKEMENKIDILILAAGRATRLKPLYNDVPKYLIKVRNKTIAEYQLDALCNIEEIGSINIVIGYKGSMIEKKIGNEYKGKKINYIRNDLYKVTDMDYSLYLGREKIIGVPFIFLAGDVIFHESIIRRLLKTSYENCIMVDEQFQSTKVDAVIVGHEEIVCSLIAHIHGDLKDNIPDSINLVGEPLMMIKFDENYGQYIISAIKEYRTKRRCKHLMYILAELFTVYQINYLSVDNIPWIEIDNVDDIDKAVSIVDKMTQST